MTAFRSTRHLRTKAAEPARNKPSLEVVPCARHAHPWEDCYMGPRRFDDCCATEARKPARGWWFLPRPFWAGSLAGIFPPVTEKYLVSANDYDEL